MEIIYIVITDEIYNYENSVINKHAVKCIEEEPDRSDQLKLKLEGAFVHYLMKELRISAKYRGSFIKHMRNNLKHKKCLEIQLQPTINDLIDYNWNDRVYVMAREKCELDQALSWLSTLGGAFSALGDFFEQCAETAAKISINQFKLAVRLGDPQIMARCKLYFALSLIQRKRFKLAKRIIHNEYKQGINAVVVDVRLLRMCKGIWAKLQYEHLLHVEHNKKCKIK